jgi:hypothetical protein
MWGGFGALVLFVTLASGCSIVRGRCAGAADTLDLDYQVAPRIKTPEYQPGAASITLRRYTHTLPGELERARDLLDRFLSERTVSKRRVRR